MKTVKRALPMAFIFAVVLFFIAAASLSAQEKVVKPPEDAKFLHVEHKMTTTGLPFIKEVTVYNLQEFWGDRLSRSKRSSKIEMGDSVLSEASRVFVCDLNNDRQIYVNDENKNYAVKGFKSTEFAVIDPDEDAAGPQIKIEKTGNTKEISGLNCMEISVKLDHSSNTGVGETKVKKYFKGVIWVTKEIKNYQLYLDYNAYAHKKLRGSMYVVGGFYDILKNLGVDEYNLIQLIEGMEGVPVEATFVAQLPSDAGGNVFETKIELVEHSSDKIDTGRFGIPEGYDEISVSDYRTMNK